MKGSNISFSDFLKREHAKRVNHFIRFINAHSRKATIEDCIEIFGFVEKDARPIFDDAMAQAVVQFHTKAAGHE